MDIAALLKAYGAPDTPQNVNALTQRYASDPTAADRRIHGLQGQSDESGGSRDAILNMMIDQVAAPTQVPTELHPVSPMVQNASTPTRRSATAARAPIDSRQLSNSAPSAGDPLANAVNGAPPLDAPASTSGDWSTLDYLAPLIGILGAGALAKPVYNAVGKRIAPTTPPEATYAGPLNKNIVPDNNVRMGPDRIGSDIVKEPAVKENPQLEQNIKADNRAPSKVTGSSENEALARKAQVQAELDAANAEGKSVQEQMLAQEKRKKWSPKNAARNAFGRK